MVLIATMGWVYSLAWSLSFYGQIYVNWKLKKYLLLLSSAVGMSIDFVALNLNGFLFYVIYNVYGYYVDDTETGSIELADLAFALHAFIATLSMTTQAWIYSRRERVMNKHTIIIVCGQWLLVLFDALLGNVILD